MSALDTQVGGNHYRNGTIQPVQYIEANQLGYLEGVVLKRITRHNQPGGKGRQDIEKAIHELQLLLELRYMPKAPVREPNLVPPKDHVGFGNCLVCGRLGGHGGLPCPSAVAIAYNEGATSNGSCESSRLASGPDYPGIGQHQPLAGTSPGIGQKP